MDGASFSQSLSPYQANFFVCGKDKRQRLAQFFQLDEFDSRKGRGDKRFCVTGATPVKSSFAFSEPESIAPNWIVRDSVGVTDERQLNFGRAFSKLRAGKSDQVYFLTTAFIRVRKALDRQAKRLAA